MPLIGGENHPGYKPTYPLVRSFMGVNSLRLQYDDRFGAHLVHRPHVFSSHGT